MVGTRTRTRTRQVSTRTRTRTREVSTRTHTRTRKSPYSPTSGRIYNLLLYSIARTCSG
jgi:hypothetical protein